MPRTFSTTIAGPERAALPVRAAGGIARAWRRLWQWQARRATLELLSSLDDRTLHDIGIGRSEIPSVVYGRHCDHLRRCDEGGGRWSASPWL